MFGRRIQIWVNEKFQEINEKLTMFALTVGSAGENCCKIINLSRRIINKLCECRTSRNLVRRNEEQIAKENQVKNGAQFFEL